MGIGLGMYMELDGRRARQSLDGLGTVCKFVHPIS